MRQQSRLLENELAHGRDVIERPPKTPLAQKIPRFRENPFRLIAQTEQGLPASGARALLGQRKYFVGRHEMRPRLSWIPSKRAVAAVIPTKRRQRNEHLFRIADNVS